MFDGLSLAVWFWGTVTYFDKLVLDGFAASELAHQWQLSRSLFCGVELPGPTPATTTFPLPLSTPSLPPPASWDFRTMGSMAPLILFFYIFSLLLLVTVGLMVLKRLSKRSLSCRLAYPMIPTRSSSLMMPTPPSSRLIGMNWELSVGNFSRKQRGLGSSGKQGQQRRPAVIARLLREAQAANRRLSQERTTNSTFRDQQTATLNSRLEEIAHLKAQVRTANDTIRDQRATLDCQLREITTLQRNVRIAEETTRNAGATADRLQRQRDQAKTDLSDANARLEKEVKATLEERMAKDDLWSQYETATSVSTEEIALLKKEVGEKAKEVEAQMELRKDLSVELEAQGRQLAELKELHRVSTRDLNAKHLDLESLRSDSTAAIDALERKNEEVKMEAKKWRQDANDAEDARQEKADKNEKLIKKLKEERDTHELEIAQLLQQLEEAKEARATKEPSGEVVAQGMTGSSHRRTEAQPAVEADKTEASGVVKGKLSGGDEQWEGKGKEEMKKEHHR